MNVVRICQIIRSQESSRCSPIIRKPRSDGDGRVEARPSSTPPPRPPQQPQSSLTIITAHKCLELFDPLSFDRDSGISAQFPLLFLVHLLFVTRRQLPVGAESFTIRFCNLSRYPAYRRVGPAPLLNAFEFRPMTNRFCVVECHTIATPSIT